MRENLPKIIDDILGKEGGYVDHERDNGGATNHGVTHRTLASWRGRPVTKADVRALTRAEAVEIYRAMFWNVIRGDELPAGVDLAVMDAAINSGPRAAARWLQIALGVKVDGFVGPKTVAAARAADPAVVIRALSAYRLNMMRRHEDWDVFGDGWSRRVEFITATALTMIEPVRAPNIFAALVQALLALFGRKA